MTHGLNLTGALTQINAKRAAASGGPVHYLAPALHSNRMSRATLDAMMAAVGEAGPLGRRALQLQARAVGKAALHPADLFAPAPPVPGDSATGNTTTGGTTHRGS